MRVLVATSTGQGKRKNDFFHATEGELIGFASECDGEKIDGQCGCRRSMAGLVSLKATTTFKVAEVEMGAADLEKALTDSLVAGGWAKLFEGDELGDMVKADAKELTRLADLFPLGVALEKRGNKIQTRF